MSKNEIGSKKKKKKKMCSDNAVLIGTQEK